MEKRSGVVVETARPRCYLVYAIAPKNVKASQANRTINDLIADPDMPLALWHDHFLGGPGGCIVFYVKSAEQQQALFNNNYLTNWHVDYRPMVFSFSPSAFDAQISYTMKAYGGVNWDKLRTEERPDYGGRDIQREAETAKES